MTQGHTERLEAALAGRYRIERKLGEGGMASVYLAEDLKHERKVALKILRPELAAVIGAERFLSEIKTTANLQHPHILPLFDSGSAEGYLYYVMPYIDGETLRDKLDREKQLGVDESIRIAKDVADALDYAHRHDVIHRDIKPGNILLHDGRPVVADFGIALAVSAAGGGRMTETGLSLGTPHYMSPEQASADRDLSAKSDVYSLGCVLYEMIAGQPPHTGPSAQSILVHILTEDPKPLSRLRHTVPPNVAAAVAKSIEKLPADRFESAKEFRQALEDEAFTYQAKPRAATDSAQLVAAAPPAGLPWLRDSRSVAALVAAVLMAGLAAWGWLRPDAPSSPVDVMRFTVVPSEEAPVNAGGGARDISIARDGTYIVYNGSGADGQRIYVRRLDQLGPEPLRGSEEHTSPFVSPDGQWVGLESTSSNITVNRISILGGPLAPVTVLPATMRGASWGSDDWIVFGTAGSGLVRAPAGGGEPEPLTTLADGEQSHRHPFIIEGHGAVVFTIFDAGQGTLAGELAVLDLESGEVTRLGLTGLNPRYVSTGHLVYAAEDGSLRAVPFDAESLTLTGNADPLLDGVLVKSGGGADFDVSDNGRLIYVLGTAAGVERSLLWVDREGREQPIAATPRAYIYPRLSPGGDRVALDVRSDLDDIWIWTFASGTSTRMTLGEDAYEYPVWAPPDGGRLAYVAGGSLFWKASNDTGEPALIAENPGSPGAAEPSPYFFTPDGAALVLRDQATPDTDDDLLMIPVEGDQTPTWELRGASIERNAELSPNGRWMAYQSNQSGQHEIYVRPFPDVQGDLFPISSPLGGIQPVWSRDGSELFYLQPGGPGYRLVSVSVTADDPDGRFRYGQREVVMDWPYYAGSEGRNYDVAIDGQRFLAVSAGVGGEASAAPVIQVVLNWLEVLRDRAGS